MPREEPKVSRAAGNVQRLAVKLREKIGQVEKAAGQQGRRAMLDHQKAYEEELRAQLQEWEEQVGLYRAKAESATDLAREEFYEITAALQRMQDETRMKLQELRRAGNGDLADSNNDAENAWSEVRTVSSSHASCSQEKLTTV